MRPTMVTMALASSLFVLTALLINIALGPHEAPAAPAPPVEDDTPALPVIPQHVRDEALRMAEAIMAGDGLMCPDWDGTLGEPEESHDYHGAFAEMKTVIRGADPHDLSGTCRVTCTEDGVYHLAYQVYHTPSWEPPPYATEADVPRVGKSYVQGLCAGLRMDPAKLKSHGSKPLPPHAVGASPRDAWQSYRTGEGPPVSSITLHINAFTGTIQRIELSTGEPHPIMKGAPKDEATRQRAIQLLDAELHRRNLPALADSELIYEFGPSPQRREGDLGWTWAFEVALGDRASAHPSTTQRVGFALVLPLDDVLDQFTISECQTDAIDLARETGRSIRDANLILHPKPSPYANMDPVPVVTDSMPVPFWGGRRVLLAAARHFEAYPPFYWVGDHPYLLDPTDPSSLRIADIRYGCEELAAGRSTPWVAWLTREDLAFCNITTGERYRLDTWYERLALASASPCLLAQSHNTGIFGKPEWMAFTPGGDGGLAQRPVQGLTGDDVAVAFSMDDSQLAILRAEGEDEDAQLRLDLARVTEAFDVVDRRTLADLGALGNRSRFLRDSSPLWWLPDDTGIYVRMWDDREAVPVVIDPHTGASERFLTPAVVDPDTGEPMRVLNHSARLLDSDTLVFAAMPMGQALQADGNGPERGHRLYACNTDGTGVRRLTPLDDEPIPRYHFPQTGAPAFLYPWEEQGG